MDSQWLGVEVIWPRLCPRSSPRPARSTYAWTPNGPTGSGASGAAAVTEVSFDNSTFTTISSRGLGLSNINIDATSGVDTVGGGENASYSQRSGYTQRLNPFTILENDTTRALFMGRHGHTMYVRHSPEGTASGMPRWTWSGKIILSHIGGAGSTRSFNINQGINGAVDMSGTNP